MTNPPMTKHPVHFTAIAGDINGKEVKEHLNSFNEFQLFAHKMAERGFTRLTASSFDERGIKVTIAYLFIADEIFGKWEKVWRRDHRGFMAITTTKS